MKNLIGILLISVSLIMNINAHADNTYVTVHPTFTSFTLLDTNTIGIGGGFGYNVSPIFSVEGTIDYLGTKSFNSIGITAYSYGIWAVVNPTIANIGQSRLKFVGRVGVTANVFDVAFGNYTYTETNTNMAYGFGMVLSDNTKTDFIVDYQRRKFTLVGYTIDADTINLGIKHTF